MIRPQTCPICGKVVPPATDPSGQLSPFCSLRCKQVDLLRWSNGQYAIVEPLKPEQIEDMTESADEDTPM
ncbi:MAG: DNA gyrase inhibitor YacG [Planctomycetes bacterium]|nr:DNA gyrase inhibitor YacG [Planctomycetota bacterium]